MTLSKLIDHQSTGAKGLRIAATVCIVLGWISILFCTVAAIVNANEIIFIFPILCGFGGYCVMYVIACFLRSIASVAEAAELYYCKNLEELSSKVTEEE